MARKATVVISLRDNYTAVMKKARRYTSAFDKDVQKMTARLDAASKKKHDIRVKNSAAMKAMNALEKKIAPMRNVMVKVAAHIQHFKHQIKPVTDTFKKIATKAWTITLKVKDGVSFVLTKINTALKKVGKGIAIGAAAVLAAGGYALNKGMALEGYGISMEHFVGVNNPKASQNQVKKQTDDYLKWLRTNANATPFGTEEVVQAGSRAVQITSGNTKAAQGLVKMAEDMAALTPGKTVMDAMEALADANMGEMERMKEFGFKMTADEFKKAGYDLFSTKNTTGKTLVEVFGGGAEKFANTTTGMWSTITGEIQSDIADIGLEMAKGLKPFLGWVRDSVLPDIRKFITEPLKGSGKTGMETLTDGIKWLYYWLKEQIPLAIESIKSAWAGFAKWFDDPNGIVRQVLGGLGVNLPTVSATHEPGYIDPAIGRANRAKRTKNGGYGEPIAPIPANSVFAGNLPSGGKQINLGDVALGYFGLKAASLGSKLFTGKGLFANGANLVKEGIKAGAAAGASAVSKGATALAGANPAAGAAMANGTAWLGNLLRTGGGSTLIPGAGTWFENQMNAANVDYANATGKQGSPAEVFAWKVADFNNQISKNAKAWGDNVNNTVDDVLGIKRLPNGLPDLGAMWGWGIKRDPVSQWAGIPGVSQTGPVGGGTSTNPLSQWGGIPGVMKSIELSPATADSVGKVADALKTPPSSGWLNISGAISAISTAATNAAATVKALIDRLAALSSTHANTGGGNKGGGGKGFAAGIKRVPSDNYPALLHKGEAVLNSAEAGEYRANGNASAKAGNVFNLSFDLKGTDMDENRLAAFVVEKINEAAANMA